jgi:XRE family transcriptional regulator, regulator of sulfur utilization
MSAKREDVVTSAEERIGPELKRLREEAGLSVRTLAERAGFSASFISQLENGQVSPSIASLEKIAATLNVTLAGLFAVSPRPEATVVRAAQRPGFRSSWSKARIEALTPLATPHVLEGLMVTLDGGGSSGKRPDSVAYEQMAVVFSGRVILTMGDESIDVSRGDAVFIPAGMAHRWHNSYERAAEILLVSARPSR